MDMAHDWPVFMECWVTDNLILRSRAQRDISKDGQQPWCIPPQRGGYPARSRRPCGPPQGEVRAIPAVNEIVEVLLDNYLSISYTGIGANQAARAVAREQCRYRMMQEAAAQASRKRPPRT